MCVCVCVCVSQDRDYFLAEQVGFITETSGTYWVVHTESLNVSESPPPNPSRDTFIDVAQDRDVTGVQYSL